MKLFVTGANGMLGHDVVKQALKRGYEAVGCGTRPGYDWGDEKPNAGYICLDITDEAAVNKALTEFRPDAVIHCAAWSAVDAAEKPENRDRVRDVNVNGTEYIAKACGRLGAKLLYLSTDYVFPGTGDEPNPEDSNDFGPLNVYGETKLEGERKASEYADKHFIVRISWAFGLNGDNFVKIMLRAGEKYDTVRVVTDQIGTPTYTIDAARLLLDMAETEKYGVYHLTNEGGYVSKYDYCKEMYRLCGLKTNVIPVTTEEYGGAGAKRPLNGRLQRNNIKKFGFIPLPDWKDALNRYINEELKYGTDKCD